MSNSHRRFRAISRALKKLIPCARGNQARHLNVLAAMICGIVGSQRVNLPAMIGEVPFDVKEESIVQRFERWVDNGRIDLETY